MYGKEIMKRFKSPKFSGEIKNADAVGEEGNVKCGDIMKIYLKVKDNTIKDIKFQTYGCMAAIASSDAMCEIAKGKTVQDALKISSQDIVKVLGEVPAIKVHCSVLGSKALRSAINNYNKRTKCLDDVKVKKTK